MTLSVEAIYDAIATTKCQNVTLQFMPEDDIVIVEENGVCEVGISKKAYLGIFTQGHHYLEAQVENWRNSKEKNDENRKPDTGIAHQHNLSELYMATNAVLLTTNDHLTCWRYHEEIVGEMSRKDPEILVSDFKFCLALATLRLAKINKSSGLWHWLRRLSVILAIEQDKSGLEELLELVLVSMERHLANYAASHTFMWTFDVLLLLGRIDFENLEFETLEQPKVSYHHILGLLRSRCRANLHDISLWTVLTHVLGRNPNSYCLVHLAELQKRNSAVFGQTFQPRSLNNSCNVKSDLFRSEDVELEAQNDLDWLLAVQCAVRLPYRLILGISNLETSRQKLEARLSETQKSTKQFTIKSTTANQDFCRTLEWAIQLTS